MFSHVHGGYFSVLGVLRGQKILTMLVKAHTFVSAIQCMGPRANVSSDSVAILELSKKV